MTFRRYDPDRQDTRVFSTSFYSIEDQRTTNFIKKELQDNQLNQNECEALFQQLSKELFAPSSSYQSIRGKTLKVILNLKQSAPANGDVRIEVVEDTAKKIVNFFVGLEYPENALEESNHLPSHGTNHKDDIDNNKF